MVFVFLLVSGCNNEVKKEEKKPATTAQTDKTAEGEKLFREVPANESGVDFVNRLVEDQNINFYRYQYLYNGGGVAVADFNNDGLFDVYFTGNMSPDMIYLNKGGITFENISAKAGISDAKGWKTGVSIADVNEDGFQDIYVCRSGWYPEDNIRQNLLYINNGDLTFTESAKEYGLDETGNSVQSAFFDYDRDGDLDVYITNHPISYKQTLGERMKNMKNPSDRERDKLYENNGDGSFTEVSRKAGIVNYGHGLGLVVSDMNRDGWEDIYIANDFQSQDYYYENNKDGTFSSKLEETFKHCSYFAMGTDIADINNDGHLDVYTVEMLAEDNKRQKTNMAPMNPEIFFALVDLGFHWQMMRNSLQLNNGNGSFSEIGYHSGVTSTDWSWGPLLADYDHDGDKDLIITNGYLKDTQDKDFVKKSNKLAKMNNNRLSFQDVNAILPSTRIQNYAYEYQGDYKFKDVSENWGFDFSGFSNGVAYADFDNDGDLDLMVNNINDPASVYENRAESLREGKWLKIEFKGTKKNPTGIGNKVRITTSEGIQYQEMQVVRGFQSAVSPELHFGLGKNATVQKVEIEWWDGKSQILEGVEANQKVTVAYTDATGAQALMALNNTKPEWKNITDKSGVFFTHTENEYDDYKKEILLPHKQSQNGPKIAVADVNGDGMDDFFIGGAANQGGELFVQAMPGKFRPRSGGVFKKDRQAEDIGSTFFDADGDGDMDLYVVSGGNEFNPGSPVLQDRLYLNDGTGNFTRARSALPEMFTSGGCVAAGDYDKDGDLDLFVGGRLIPGQYPFAPRSYLLKNDGGKFTDVTATDATDLLSPGLINSATWTDFDGDGNLDLIAVGEWTQVLMLRNAGGTLENKTEEYGLGKSNGWWNKVIAEDFDQDGDMDYVLGNLGLNYKYSATTEEPFHVYCHDFDENGSLDIVLGYYNSGKCFPVRGRQCSSEQIPSIAEKFPTYEEYGTATIDKVYGDGLEQALHLQVYTFANSYLENQGSGKFDLRPLPSQTQFAPIMGLVSGDFNGDGNADVLGAGNLYVAEVETGRADAGVGNYLQGDGKGGFSTVNLNQSGFFTANDVKDLALLSAGEGKAPVVIVANNDDRVQVFQYVAGGSVAVQ